MEGAVLVLEQWRGASEVVKHKSSSQVYFTPGVPRGDPRVRSPDQSPDTKSPSKRPLLLALDRFEKRSVARCADASAPEKKKSPAFPYTYAGLTSLDWHQGTLVKTNFNATLAAQELLHQAWR